MDATTIQQLAALLRKVIALAGSACSYVHRKQKVDDLTLNDVSDAFSNLVHQLNEILPKKIVAAPVKKRRTRKTEKLVTETETPTDDDSGTQPTA